MSRYQEGVLTKYVPVARYLIDHFDAGTRLAVYPDAGVVPYRTDFTTIDFGRLNDAYLAREAPSPAGIAQYFYENMPGVLVVAQDAPGKLWDAGADVIVRSPRFAQEYALAFETLDSNGAGLLVYGRRP